MIRAGAIVVSILSPASADTGANLFSACKPCHEVGERAQNSTGPHLNNLIGRPVGSVAGYPYSDTMAASEIVWGIDTLDSYLADPRGFLPGARTVHKEYPSRKDRSALIDYMADFSDAIAPQADPALQAIMALDGDTAYGEYLSSGCTGCHAAESSGHIPVIHGLPADYVAAGLVDFREGRRQHKDMGLVASRLGNEEIAALAAYFSEVE